MREIEFRGFYIGDGTDVVRITGPDGNARFCGGRWLTGSLVRWADGDTSILRSDPDDDSDHLSQYFVLPETVGEWTGYCDKNSRRIYEGDRVRVPDSMRSRGAGDRSDRAAPWRLVRAICGGRLGFPLDQRHGRGGHRHRVRPGGDGR